MSAARSTAGWPRNGRSCGLRGRSHTKPGSLLKAQIPIRTWAEWDDAAPGFVEIDLVGHEGGNARGEFCFTLTVTDIATGWTVNRSVRNKAQKWVFAALQQQPRLPVPHPRIDSDNGSEFINDELLRWCSSKQDHLHPVPAGEQERRRARGAEELARVRELVGYHRYDTAAELELLNPIWELTPMFTNYLLPQQKLVSKIRHRRQSHQETRPPRRRRTNVPSPTPTVAQRPKIIMNAQYKRIKPASLSRQILALTGQLETLAQAKKAPRSRPPVNHGFNPHLQPDLFQ